MPEYTYLAVDQGGKEIKGELVAYSAQEVQKRLTEIGLIPVDVRRKTKGGFSLFKGKKVKRRDLLTFTIQFFTIADSGVPIVRGLEEIGAQMKNPYFKKVIFDIKQRIELGESLSQALSHYPKIFPNYYLGAIKTGEESGKLTEILRDLIVFLEKQEALAAELKQAMTYPIFVTFALGGVAIFYVFIILPKVLELVSQLNQKISGPTRLLMDFINTARQYWYLPLIGIFLLVFAVLVARKHERGRYYLDLIKIKIPILGNIVLKAILARFAANLALLLRSGVEIVGAFQMLGQTIGNSVIREGILLAMENLKGGASITEAIAGLPFTPFVLSMIAIGEETGRLEEELSKVANYYEKDVERATKQAITLLEPMMLIIFGIGAAGVFIAVLTPIYDAISKLQ